MASSVEIQLKHIMDEYQEKVQTVSREACKKVSKNLARTLKGTSPKRPGGGEYAAGWTSKMLDSDTYVVYNKAKPGLTHLLENSHVIKTSMGRLDGLMLIHTSNRQPTMLRRN